MSPTARSLQLLRKAGYEAGVVERRNPRLHILHDFLGCIDVIGCGVGIIGIQATSASNQSSRVKKILAEPRAKAWLRAGGRLYVHGWGKKKLKRGGKAVRWQCNEIEITERDFLEQA